MPSYISTIKSGEGRRGAGRDGLRGQWGFRQASEPARKGSMWGGWGGAGGLGMQLSYISTIKSGEAGGRRGGWACIGASNIPTIKGRGLA